MPLANLVTSYVVGKKIGDYLRGRKKKKKAAKPGQGQGLESDVKTMKTYVSKRKQMFDELNKP